MLRWPLKTRRGAIAVMTGLMLIALLGMVAMAVDVGWIVMARTQSQAAADAGALAGGTELVEGLGHAATKTPDQVATAARPVVATYAGMHRIAEQASAYIDQSTDIEFGRAVFASGAWQQTIGGTPYNMVRVTQHRDRSGSSNADVPLPLFFARVLGTDQSHIKSVATAVLMPVSGFSLPPGSDQTADIAPFAYRELEWERFLAAQDHYATTGLTAAPTADPSDPYYGTTATLSDGIAHSLYHHTVTLPNGSTQEVQSWADNWTYTGGTPPVVAGGNGILEMDLYPTANQQQYAGGNFGTLNIPEGDNSTSHLSSQITNGISSADLNAWIADVGSIEFGPDNPFVVAEGDPGISNQLKAALDAILGECRAVALFSAVDDQNGNNTTYTLTGWAGLRIVSVEMTSNPKHVWVEACTFTAGGGVPDYDEEPGTETTVFAPLILIE